MKKIILTALVAIASITANAQVWVGGQLGFSVTNNDATDKNLTEFTIAPEIGYSLSDKWDIAIALGDKYSKPEDFDATNDFFVNPYARYTFVKLDKVNFFVDGGFEYNYVKVGDEKANGFGINIKPGVAVNLNEKVSFVAHVGEFGWASAKAKNAKSVQSVDLGLNLTAVDFGLYFNF